MFHTVVKFIIRIRGKHANFSGLKNIRLLELKQYQQQNPMRLVLKRNQMRLKIYQIKLMNYMKKMEEDL